MVSHTVDTPIRHAFVTGATGLLGNNLVRELVARGVVVKALARNITKAKAQLGDLAGVEVVEGDMLDVAGFADQLAESDVLFHTAAYFRDSYKGGSHWNELEKVNVDGTRALIAAAHASGLRRMVMTSSIAVLDGPRGALIDESMRRDESGSDDYYRSKIRSDRVVFEALEAHPDFDACFVLPAWMWGPGDAGPTSAAQTAIDFIKKKLPGVPASTFSFVDARDVALAQIAAATRGRRGERYLAAGRFMPLRELFGHLEKVTGVSAPKTNLPFSLLFVIAALQEASARLTGKSVLLSWAAVKSMASQAERTRFSNTKSLSELGLEFRPVEETLRDTVAWLQDNGLAPAVDEPLYST